ncbi:MAG: NAD(P)H-binding protein [Gammaproteobacteria bacterium]|nr:NAD(P)H-binding protein [Gammaproteobacteria bacterium]
MKVAVFGGTGFVGGYLVDALLAAGHEPSLLVRPGSEGKVRQADRCTLVAGDLSDKEAIGAVLEGCHAAIYNVGLLREFPRRGITFEDMHHRAVVRVVEAMQAKGISRLLLMSAAGIHDGGTPYQVTKLAAERHALESGLDVTVFRPSVIFGDPRGTMEIATQLYQQMVRPPLPAVRFVSDGQDVMMSPVHVEDVASAFVGSLENPGTYGKTYELGGPEALSWAEMIRRIADAKGRKKMLMAMPIGVMKFGARLFDWLPFFPATRDQLTMLAEGNVVAPSELEALVGRPPKPFFVEHLSYL